MLLRDEGPQSSMDEDLKALKLTHLFESAGDKRRAAVAADAANAEAASPRTEVPVRNEAAGEDDYGATTATPPPPKDGGAKPGDDGEDGKDKPEPKKAPKDSGDEDGDGDDDDMKEGIEAVLGMSEQDVDGLDEDELDGALAVVHALEDIAESPAPKLDAAFGVIDSFYSQLAEGETTTIDRDTLVGVVESMEHILSDFGLIGEMKGMGGAIMRHAKRSQAHGKMMPTASMTKQAKVKEMKVKLGKKHAFKKGLASFKPPVLSKGKGTKTEQADTTIASLVGSLTALRNVVKESANTATTGAELAEGLKAVHETATAWYEAIAKEVKAGLAEGKVDQNDPRIAIGQHLNSIADDAAANLAAIESGATINTEAAEYNLRNLAADLDDAAAVMKTVE